MLQALYTGVSGLNARTTELDVIGDNIANVGTTGYKASTVSFQDLYSRTISPATAATEAVGGINASQVGSGTTIASISLDMTSGTPETTGSATDLAISGNGFLCLGNGVSTYYSRDGALEVDDDGNLVQSSTGLKVLGWQADPITGAYDTTQALTSSSALQIRVGEMSIARQTSDIEYAGNLNSSKEAGDTARVSSQIYDSLGAAHTVTINLTRLSALTGQGYADTTNTVGTGTFSFSVGGGAATDITVDSTNNTLAGLAAAINSADANVTATVVDHGVDAGASRYTLELTSAEGDVTVDTSGMTAGTGGVVPTFSTIANGRWAWSAASDDAAAGTSVGSGVLEFDASGQCISDPSSIALTLADANGATTTINSAVSFGAMTQLEGDDSARMSSQNGMTYGVLEDFAIDSDGVITGSFDNGMSLTLGCIAMAGFSNPEGLMKMGSNLLQESLNSGSAMVTTAGTNGLGDFEPGALESSNVDLTTELANMIVAQRAFQANSKVVTTADDILQEMMQLKR